MLRLMFLVVLLIAGIAAGASGSYSGNIEDIDPDSTYGRGDIVAGVLLLLLIYGVFKFAHSLGLFAFLDADWMRPIWALLILCVASFMGLQVLGLLLVVLYWLYEWWWIFLPLALYLIFKSRRPADPPPPPAAP